MSTTQTIDYDALAKQAGAISSQPAAQPAVSGDVDYNALAKQAGAITSQPAPAAQSSPAQSSGLVGPTGDTAVSATPKTSLADVAEGISKIPTDPIGTVSR